MRKLKLLAIFAAVTILLSGCNIVNVTEVASIGDTVAKKGEFMYYLTMAKTLASQEAQMAGQTIATDKDWDSVMIDGKTAANYAKDEATSALKTVMTLYQKALDAGYTVTDEVKTQINTNKEQIISQLGGRYEYENTLSNMGITTDDLNVIVERSVIAENYQKEYEETDESPKASDEEVLKKYNEEYVFVRHILISNQVPETPNSNVVMDEGEAVTPEEPKTPEDYDAAAKAEAEEVLKKLGDGADFVTLMNEYSDDGRGEDGTLQSTGYIMTDNGQMVKPFEDAAMALSEGAYTEELVQSEFGYHIIKREALPVSGDEYDNALASIRTEINTEKMEEKVNAWAEELGLKLNLKFIDKVRVKMEG